jgi:hypothetical protein
VVIIGNKREKEFTCFENSISFCKSQPWNMPNNENCTIEGLETAAKGAPSKRTFTRLMVIKALEMDLPHGQVAACLVSTNIWRSAINKI